MASMPSREHLGPRAENALINELAAILAGAGSAVDTDLAEYDQLFPDDPEAVREEAIRAAARRADQFSDDEIYRLLFDTEEET